MIDFNEELKNYKPIAELDDVEGSIHLDEISDISDLLGQILKQVKGDK